MPKTHARYWIDESLKREIEDIAATNERWSASFLAEKFMAVGVSEFKKSLQIERERNQGGDTLRGKIGKIKK